MSDAVLDLDVLRPKRRIVKLGGHEIDVSFIPLAITFDLEDVLRELAEVGVAEIEKGGKAAKRGLELAIKLCATFCEWRYPDLTEQWFRENVDAAQLNLLAAEIRNALSRAYAGIDSKNAEAAQDPST